MYIKIVVVSLIAFFAQHVVRIIYTLGYHVTVYNHSPGPCSFLPGIDQGSEDMESLPNGLTFITSGVIGDQSSGEYKKRYADNNHKGKILLFDFNRPEKGVTELGIEGNIDQSTFHPHGISLWQNEETGTVTLFVVNHPPGVDKIEKFEFNSEKQVLVHKKSYQDPSMRLVNDVAAAGEDSFYFTNFAYSTSALGSMMEFMLFLPWANIVYHNGTDYTVAADNLLMANGILLSKDKHTVYSANGLFMSMSVFQREEDNSLALLTEFPLYASPDNFLLEPRSGNVIVAVHPVIYKTEDAMAHPVTAKSGSPSKVLMIEMKDAQTPVDITELYSDDGSRLSGSSVASIYDNKMLIGTIFDKLMYCEVHTL